MTPSVMMGDVRLGIADHFGWAVAVTTSARHEVVDRRRMEPVEAGLPAAPIHYEAKRLDVDATAALVANRCGPRSSGRRRLRSTTSPPRSAEPIVSISLRTWPLDFPGDIAVQRRPPYESRVTPSSYRQVLSDLAHAAGAGTSTSARSAKDVVGQAVGLLGALGRGGPRGAAR